MCDSLYNTIYDLDLLQETVDLLMQFKDFIVKYNRTYTSQEGNHPHCIYSNSNYTV